MLVMNDDWERSKVPKAIGELMRDMMVCVVSLYRCCVFIGLGRVLASHRT